MKNLAEIKTIVQGYLEDEAADVEQPIIDSINFLSNLFSIDSLDETQSTAVDGSTLELPTGCLEIDTVFLNGEEIRPLKNLKNLEEVRQMDIQRWYEFGDKIQFTQDFTEIEEAKIWYKKGFTEPETAVDTDVPEKLFELIYLGAQYRYYAKLLAKKALSKKNLPDIKASELRQIHKEVKANFFEQVKIIQLNS